MHLAISLAMKNRAKGGDPVGAIVVQHDRVVARAVTTLRKQYDPTAHAEINAIRAACKAEKSRYLADCILYTTFEPCPMCTSTAIWAKMRGIVFGSRISDQTTNVHQRIAIPAAEVIKKGKPKLEICGGFLRDECLPLLN